MTPLQRGGVGGGDHNFSAFRLVQQKCLCRTNLFLSDKIPILLGNWQICQTKLWKRKKCRQICRWWTKFVDNFVGQSHYVRQNHIYLAKPYFCWTNPFCWTKSILTDGNYGNLYNRLVKTMPIGIQNLCKSYESLGQNISHGGNENTKVIPLET